MDGFAKLTLAPQDVPLSDTGKREASEAADQLHSFLYDIDACFTSILSRAQDTLETCLDALHKPPDTYIDYRLSERHYGALQGFVKKEVEDGKFGHDPDDVEAWRRSWYAVPPQLTDDDPRRVEELAIYGNIAPRGESLEMVAKHRIRPFVNDVLTPVLDEAATRRHSRQGTGLIVAHANSLRALLGVLCEVEDDLEAIHVLEQLKIPTGIPLVIRYQQLANGKFQALPPPEADECLIRFDEGLIKAPKAPPGFGHPKLPVWPLDTCMPILSPEAIHIKRKIRSKRRKLRRKVVRV